MRHSDLRSASRTVTGWHRSVIDGDLHNLGGFWADPGVVVTEAGPRSVRLLALGAAWRRCDAACDTGRMTPTVESFFRLRPDLIALTVDLATSAARPRGCPAWSGTYVLQQTADGLWHIRMFAAHS